MSIPMHNIFFWFLLNLGLLPGDGVRIKTDLSKPVMTIGEVLVYTIRIEYPEKTKLTGEPETDFSDFEITRIQEYEPVLQNGMITKRTEYLLTTFNIDTFLIRGPVLKYLSKGDTVTVRGDSKMVIVTSVLDSSASDIRPEKPIMEGEIDWFGLIASGAGILLALGVLAYFLYRRYKKHLEKKLRDAALVPAVVKTPEEEAMEQLTRLRKSGMAERGDYKLFHIEISNIIRTYTERITPVQAMELPTSDLVRELKRKSLLNESYIQLLRSFLEVCDLVKFAKYASTVQECLELYEQAVRIVHRGAEFHMPEKPLNTAGAS